DFEPFMAQKSHYIMHLARYLNRMSPTDSADEPFLLITKKNTCYSYTHIISSLYAGILVQSRI
ncbi:hypothetical protein, partial [Nitrosomonas halophila]